MAPLKQRFISAFHHGLALTGIVLLLTCLAVKSVQSAPPTEDRVRVTSTLIQQKVLQGSDGRVKVALDLTADDQPWSDDRSLSAVDLMVVLDRSGSMQGRKIEDARRAVIHLIDRLTPKDRLGLVAYSDYADTLCPLVSMDAGNRNRLLSAVSQVTANGSTNLGDGLALGIDPLRQTPASGRVRKVILISDGLANRGITDPQALGRMASAACEHQIAVTTVGVGLDFNELLMTGLADYGGGRYYFLEDPTILAQVFDEEFQQARRVVAASIEIRIQLAAGQHLLDAGGYPISIENGTALIRPGNLIAGQQRRLYLTFRIPTDQPASIPLGQVRVHYQHENQARSKNVPETLTVVCVTDPKAVTQSIDKATWGAAVVQEEFSRLKEEVADAVRQGNPAEAKKQIEAYETRNQTLNAQVGSSAVAKNLKEDVQTLRQSVEATFSGPPAAVPAKQKQAAKALQYEGYQERRAK